MADDATTIATYDAAAMPSRPCTFGAARLARATLVAAIVIVAAPSASAPAATVTYTGATAGIVDYRADAGETLNTYVGFDAGCVVSGGVTYDCVTFSGDAHWSSWPTQCDIVNSALSCILDRDHSGVRVSGASGNDTIAILDAGIGGFPAAAGYAITVDGGAGDDRIAGGSGPETLHGGDGADVIGGAAGDDTLYGDAGNDTLYGDGIPNGNDGLAAGNDQLYGGDGDDTLTGDVHQGGIAIGTDLLDGGAGTDTVKDDWYRYDGNAGDEDPPPTVTFDGVANDGRPGERDNVVAIERIESGSPAAATPATFTGDDAPNTFMLLFTNGAVSGGGGDDTIAGSDNADTIDGGPGNDQLSGGFGDDAITGGPGRDNIGGDRTASCEYGPVWGVCTTGTGNDTIYAQDGEADTIDCGAGADTAYVDAIDTATGCETLHTTGAPAAPAPTPTPAAGAGAANPATPPAATTHLPRQRLASIVRHRALKLTCRLPQAGRCTVTARLSAATARHLHLHLARHAKSYKLGTARHTFHRAGSSTLTVKLSKTAARALYRSAKVRVTWTITATYAGAAHRTTTTTSTLRR